MGLPLALVLWVAVSIPVAMITGRALGRRATGDGRRPASGPPDPLHRLAEIELLEIPRVQRAIGGWADDPYLARELRELRAEAERLRGLPGSSVGSSRVPAGRGGDTDPHGRSAA